MVGVWPKTRTAPAQNQIRSAELVNFEDDQGKDRLLAVKLRCNEKVEKTNFVLISSLNESYPGGCLGHCWKAA